ncbi:MAG TPA: hypothetical protein VK034_20340 [Enhygromyxa sp.]|nr:hypothetical protein [Enhygromyxa sp.]
MEKVINAVNRRIQFGVPTPWGTVSGSLRLPFRSGFNPHVDTARRQNLRWVIDLGLIPRNNPKLADALARCQFEQLAALVHRDCSREALELITNCYTAIFVFDDMIDDSSSEIGGNLDLATHVTAYLSAAVADEPRPRLRPSTPGRRTVVAVADALADVARRLLRFTDRDGIAEYVNGMRTYLFGCVLESEKRIVHVRSIADYSAVRLRCSAMFPCFDAGAIVERLSVADEVWYDPAFQTMRKDTNLCVSYVNDVFSYAKESNVGELSNLVTVHQMVHGSTLEQAVRASLEINDGVVAEYLDAKTELADRHELDAGARGYIRLMENWMRGNFDWYHQQRTDRYTEYLTTAIPA